jgi:hypothetical protein
MITSQGVALKHRNGQTLKPSSHDQGLPQNTAPPPCIVGEASTHWPETPHRTHHNHHQRSEEPNLEE